MKRPGDGTPPADGASEADKDPGDAPDPWFPVRRSLVRAAMEAFPSGVGVLMLLLTYLRRGSTGCAFPSVDTLAQQAGVTKRTAQRALHRYTDAGIIVSERRYGATTRYRVAGRFAVDGRPQQGGVIGDTGDIRDACRTCRRGDIRDAGGVSSVSPDQKKRTEKSLHTPDQQPCTRAGAACNGEGVGMEREEQNTVASQRVTEPTVTPASPSSGTALGDEESRAAPARDGKPETETFGYVPDEDGYGEAPGAPGASEQEPTQSKAMSPRVDGVEGARRSTSGSSGTVLVFPSTLPPVDRRGPVRHPDAGVDMITPGMPEDGLDDLDLLRLDFVNAHSEKFGPPSLSLRADRRPVDVCAQAHAASAEKKPLRDWFREQVSGYLSLDDRSLREKGHPLGFLPHRLGEVAAKIAERRSHHDAYMDDWTQARDGSTEHGGVKKGSA